MAPKLPPFDKGHVNVMTRIIAEYDQKKGDGYIGSDQYQPQEAIEVLEVVRREWKARHTDQEWAQIQKHGPEAMGNVFFDPHGPEPNGRTACFKALRARRLAWRDLPDSEKLKTRGIDLETVGSLPFSPTRPKLIVLIRARLLESHPGIGRVGEKVSSAKTPSAHTPSSLYGLWPVNRYICEPPWTTRKVCIDRYRISFPISYLSCTTMKFYIYETECTKTSRTITRDREHTLYNIPVREIGFLF